MTLNLIGSTLGKYRILEELGQRGMGVVYKAHAPPLDRLVAITILDPRLPPPPDVVPRVPREPRAPPPAPRPHVATPRDPPIHRAVECLVDSSLARILSRTYPELRFASFGQPEDVAHVRHRNEPRLRAELCNRRLMAESALWAQVRDSQGLFERTRGRDDLAKDVGDRISREGSSALPHERFH